MGAKPPPVSEPPAGPSWPERIADVLRRLLFPGESPQPVPVLVPVRRTRQSY